MCCISKSVKTKLVKLMNEVKMKKLQQSVEIFIETIQLPHESTIPTIKALSPIKYIANWWKISFTMKHMSKISLLFAKHSQHASTPINSVDSKSNTKKLKSCRTCLTSHKDHIFIWVSKCFWIEDTHFDICICTYFSDKYFQIKI